MAKKDPLNSDENVDMSRIEEMMGPTPDKADQSKPEPAKKGLAQDVGGALREFNESLKAKMPGLGDADISKVEDQDTAKLPKMNGADSVDDAPEDIPAAPAAAIIKHKSTKKKAAKSDEPPTAPEVDGAPVPEEPVDEEPDLGEVAAAMVSGKDHGKDSGEGNENDIDQSDDQEEEKSEDDLSAAKKALDPAEKEAKDVPDNPDDPSLDKAVDDIVASETDELLAMEDAQNAEVSAKKPKKPAGVSFGDRISEFFHHPRMKWYVLGLVALLILAAAVVPYSRYFVLNTAGVRVSSNVEVIDEATLQPLKNVKVTFGTQSAMTDANGKADVTGIKQGSTTMTIEKSAYATVSATKVLGWGSNPLGQFKLTPTGNKYTFMVTDYLSGKGIATAAATSGKGDAEADKNGKIVLVLDTKDDATNLSVKIMATGYRDETVNLTANNKATQNIKMVPARKDVFVSKRSGKYDVYTVDVDGKNPQRIVAGTGLERDDIALVNHPTDKISALADTRENVRNSDGYLLTTLYTVDQESGELKKVDQSERIQIIGWTGDERLVYVKIVAGTSANNPQRQRLISYNTKKSGDSKELASSNSFNDILMINDKVYYAPSSAFQSANGIGLFRVNADNTGKVNVLNQEVYNIFRTDYSTLSLSVGSDWYTYKLSGDTATKATSAPTTQLSHLFVDTSDGSHSLWVDQRDGQGVLLSHDIKANTDKVLVTKVGLKNPVEWLNDQYIIYRVSDSRETADYVINTAGGTPQKITDVTDAASITSWYYY